MYQQAFSPLLFLQYVLGPNNQHVYLSLLRFLSKTRGTFLFGFCQNWHLFSAHLTPSFIVVVFDNQFFWVILSQMTNICIFYPLKFPVIVFPFKYCCQLNAHQKAMCLIGFEKNVMLFPPFFTIFWHFVQNYNQKEIIGRRINNVNNIKLRL